MKDPNAEDIAILKLATPADLCKPNIAVIPIADRCENYDNKECWISGWGAHDASVGGTPPKLQEAPMTVIPFPQCASAWGKEKMKPYEICIRRPNTETSACFGDSGGPLACKRPDGSFTLVGAASYVGANCANDPPNVYLRVPYWRSYIRDTTGIASL